MLRVINKRVPISDKLNIINADIYAVDISTNVGCDL
jgi:hypothetical protein